MLPSLLPCLLLAAPGWAQGMPQGGGGAVQNMNPNLSFIADVAAAAFSDEALSQAEGRQNGGHDPKANGFNLQQLELSVGAAVDPFFRFDANLVFSLFGVEIEEAYGTSLSLPGRTQLRAGQFLTRFGRSNNTHPHSWDFVDQPLANGRVFGGEGNRGLGVEGSILLPTPWFAELLVSQTGAAGASTARSFYGAEDLGVHRLQDLLTVAALKQFFPMGQDWSLLWGLSYMGGPNPTGRDNRTEVFGTDAYLRFKPASRASNMQLTLTSEWFWRRRQVPDDVQQDLSATQALSWHFAQRWAVAARHEFGSPTVGLDGSPSADALDPFWTADRHRITGNLTFWPSEFSRVRLQGSRDVAGWVDQPLTAAFLAVEFVTGAHGAHAF